MTLNLTLSSDHGADASFVDSDGQNSLHKAADGSRGDVIQYLLSLRLGDDNKSLSTHADNRGRTAQQLIASYRTDLLHLFD